MPNRERQGKWQPFDALDGYKTSLKRVEYEKDKITKPVIYPDQLEEMNEVLTSAFNNQEIVVIQFYRNGYIYEKVGLIDKVDPINKTIKIDNNNIKLNMIVNLNKQ